MPYPTSAAVLRTRGRACIVSFDRPARLWSNRVRVGALLDVSRPSCVASWPWLCAVLGESSNRARRLKIPSIVHLAPMERHAPRAESRSGRQMSCGREGTDMNFSRRPRHVPALLLASLAVVVLAVGMSSASGGSTSSAGAARASGAPLVAGSFTGGIDARAVGQRGESFFKATIEKVLDESGPVILSGSQGAPQARLWTMCWSSRSSTRTGRRARSSTTTTAAARGFRRSDRRIFRRCSSLVRTRSRRS